MNPKILIVSSLFVPHIGGVETFLTKLIPLLEQEQALITTLGCKHYQSDSDISLPTKFIGNTEWPIPYKGFNQLKNQIKQADLIIVNNWRQPLVPITCFLAKKYNKKVILFPHCADTKSLNAQLSLTLKQKIYYSTASLWEKVFQNIMLKNSYTYVLSNKEYEYLNNKFPSFNIKKINYPIDIQGFAHKKLCRKPLKLIWAGRFVPQKNPELAIKTVQAIHNKIPVELHFYGEGLLKEELQSKYSYPWLFFHKETTPNKVKEYQSNNVVFSTSITEGAQINILESLAAGIPTIATQAGDAPQYFSESLRWACVPQDKDELINAIEHLYNNSAADELFHKNSIQLQRQYGTNAESEIIKAIKNP